MHTNEDYENSIEEENDYSDFYNTGEEEVVKDNKGNNKKTKAIIIIVILAVILIALIVVLIFVFKKKHPVEFDLALENVTGDAWSKNNVTINVTIPDETNLKSLKYTINCDKNCDYANITDKKVIISNNGTSNVTVIATNVDNVESKKNITVKIDNISPQVTLSPNNTNIKSKDPVTVCAVCSDNESGCKEERVCKEYSKTSKDQTLTVEDNVGNKATSNKFTVTIEGSTPVSQEGDPSCTLSVNKSGLVTATPKNATSYYGFSSSYSGTSGKTKQVSLNKNGETTTVNYYVKNSDGKKASCSITVTVSNCYCKYRADDYTCYKTKTKTVDNPKSSECVNASEHVARHTNANCELFKDEGMTCEYSKKSAK